MIKTKDQKEREVTLTAKIKIDFLNAEDRHIMAKTTKAYKEACNYTSQFIFDSNDFKKYLKRSNLHASLYYELRNRFGLKSQMACSVLATVIAKYKTIETQLKKKPYKYKDENNEYISIPRDLYWLQKPVYFKEDQLDLVFSHDWSFKEDGKMFSLNTLKKQVLVSVETRGFEKYLDKTWKVGTGKVVKKKNKWFFHVPVTKEFDVFDKSKTTEVVGVDRGLRFVATTNDNKGNNSFINGKDIMFKRSNYKKRRAELQALGTKSAKRKLKKLSGRENRWMTDVNHVIAKTLVNSYESNTLFVLEDLANVRFNSNELGKSMRAKVNSWSFGQLETFITYKARLKSSKVLIVSAKYTSQHCPNCGLVDASNRNHHLHEYLCAACGYRANDDLTAARNLKELGNRYMNGEKSPKYKK